jgi:hypothetical protein
MMPDHDLLTTIDELASTRQAQGDAIGYYLDELDRRERRKQNRLMVRLTWAVVVLTFLVLVLAALSVVIAVRG